ncbi:ABC transporter permease [Cellulomonas hominis]
MTTTSPPTPAPPTTAPPDGTSPTAAPPTALAGWRMLAPRWSGKLAVGLTITGLIVAFGLVGPHLVADPWAIGDVGLTPPSAEHWLGTTQIGQDVVAQLAWATRGSLMIGVVVGVLSLVLSAFFGIVGAYIGGRTDEVFSLFTNVWLVIPGLPLVIVIGSYVQNKGPFVIAVVLAITSWAGSARVLRSQTLSIRNRDYVAASRVAGEKPWRIMSVEILPNLLPVMASQFVFAIIFAILGEAGLSFLGLGASHSLTWGTMLFYAQNAFALRMGAWWWFVPPGLMIALLGCGLSLINFSIDEIINPKLRSLPKAVRRRSRAGRRAAQRVTATSGGAA